MKKLVNGIMEFREKHLAEYRKIFAKLALGQAPDVLFIACSDSRVAANAFASTDPGDLFVVRNVGNMVPPALPNGASSSDESEAAAIEFALFNLNVTHIIICGHSECGAMHAIANDRSKVTLPNLRSWLRHGEESLNKVGTFDPHLAKHNELSQLNVLLQIEHLMTYPFIRDRVNQGQLQLHGWWFELKGADVYAYDKDLKKFIVFDRDLAKKILEHTKHQILG